MGDDSNKYLDEYIFEEPNAEPGDITFAEANQELLMPFPSTSLDDFPKFSKLMGGFRAREFSIVCGATGVGKTSLVANFSKSLILQNVPHFVASVETGRTDFMKRVMSAMLGEDLNTGEPVPMDKVKQFYIKHGIHFERNCLWFSRYENRFAVKKLMNDIAGMVKRHLCKLAIIDNLNFFLEVTKAADQIVEMDRVIHELIIFCKKVDVHVVMIMHPKKTEHGRVESEFDIKGSSTAVQEAHNVFLFNRPKQDLIEAKFAEPHDRELYIAKMRRRGRAVGKRLVLRNINGVLYQEGALV